jgi:hypothetical protein
MCRAHACLKSATQTDRRAFQERGKERPKFRRPRNALRPTGKDAFHGLAGAFDHSLAGDIVALNVSPLVPRSVFRIPHSYAPLEVDCYC